ncbi:MAG: hypothetical protein P4L43_18680 [Syntrophobacteraceae bacterium]|nr:hypothetical protein [Syntrophobacteraceae bacterium]
MHSIGPDTSEVTQAVADKLATFARPGALRSIWRRMEDILTLDPVPRMARISNFLADKAVEHASARIAAPKMVDNLLSSVFPDQYRDPEAMSKTVDILNKDNVLAGYDEFNRRANEAWSEAQSIISSSHDAARQEIYDHYVKAKEAETKGRYDLVAHWLDKAEALEAAYDKATGDTEATGTGRGKERAALREYFEWKNKAAAIGETLNKSAPEYAEYDRARGAHEEARAKQLEDARKDAEQAVEDARRDNNSDAYLAAQKKLERIEGGKLKSNNEVAALISGYRAELEEARRTGDTKAGTLAERRLAELAKNELAPDRNISSLETAMEEARNKTPKSHDLEQYERDIQAAKKDPVISANIERWKKYVNPYLDQLYNEMKGLDPAAEQEGRGKYFGARINLTTLDRAAELSKSLGDPTKPMPEPAIGSSYRNPNVKRDPFDRAAKFTGQYSTDARLALLNAVGGRWNEVTKLRLYNGLVQSGAALPFGSERPETIQGQKATELRVKVPHTDVDENGRPVGKTVYREEPLHVRADLAREVRNVLNTDMPSPANRLAQVLTHLQLAQFLDMFAHGQNLLSVLTRAQGAGSVWADVVRKIPVLGRLDGIKRIWDVSREVQSDSPAIRDEIAQMARQGLIRPEYPPDWLQKMTHGQQFIHAIDMGSRIVMNRFFDNLVERGLAQDTEANRRGYVNQVGMYNRRLMGPLMRLSRDLGLSPFVVAGRNFNLQGIRALTGNPVVTATNAGAAMQMRLMNLMGTALTASIVPMILNSIRTGHPMGRPGTPIGAWDLGLPNNEKGQHSVIDLLGWIGARRGMRATGLDALVEGLRAGHSADQIEHEAISQLEDTWSHPWMGPAPSFLYKALTGKQLDLRGRMEATQYPGEYKKQAFENSRAALKSQNALLYSVLRPLFQEYGLDTDDKTPYYQGIHQTFLKSPLAFAAVREMYPPRSAATVMALAKSGHAFDGYREGDQAKAELKQQIRVLERDGKPIPAELQEQEQALSRGAQKGLERSGHQTELETAFGYLHRGEDILSVLRLATPDELQKLQPEALNKFDRLYNGAAPADRGKIEQEHGEAMKLFGSL